MFKKTSLLLFFSFLSFNLLAQSPLEFNYQAVARDQRGVPLNNQDIKVRFSIRSESISGNVEYLEIRNITTNPFGMFSVSIGGSGAFFSSGSLSDVNWSSGKKFLQVEIDVNGGNNYKDLGATQMVSVPFALYALKASTVDQQPVAINSANGLTFRDDFIGLGSAADDTSGQFLQNRFLNLNGKSFQIREGKNKLSFNKNFIEIQHDTSGLAGDERNSGGIFLKVNPIKPASDALPFLFSRIATKQHDGATSPNEVVMWGHNLSGGGNAYIAGLPALGYSIESNFKPSPDSRWVESHEYYITPQAQQIRLKSYTINTISNRVDFYHSTDNLYIKNPRTAQEYFRVATNSDNNNLHQLLLGNFNVDVNTTNKTVQILSMIPDTDLSFTINWRYVNLPGMSFQKDGTLHLFGNFVPTADNARVMGTNDKRMSNIRSLNYFGSRAILKEGWASNETLSATATLDIEGINGFNQFRLRKTYTPTGSADPNGNTGDLSWDDNYIYIKTSTGWKRTSLESF